MRRLKQKDINFLLPMAKKKQINVAQLKKAGIVLLPVLLLGGCVSFWAALTFSQQDMRRELDELNLKMSMLQGGNAYATAQEFQKANNAKQAYLDNLMLVSACAETYPAMGTSFFSTLENCLTADIWLNSMQYTAPDCTLVLYGTARNVGDTADFVERLRKTGNFAEVTYSGWQNTERLEQETFLNYSFQIKAMLWEKTLSEEENALLRPQSQTQQEGEI